MRAAPVRDKALLFIKTHPGCTMGDVGEFMGWSANDATNRILEWRRDGFVKVGDPQRRRCGRFMKDVLPLFIADAGWREKAAREQARKRLEARIEASARRAAHPEFDADATVKAAMPSAALLFLTAGRTWPPSAELRQ